MFEVRVKLEISLMLKSRVVQSAKGTRDLKVPSLPRKGEGLFIEYTYDNDDENVIEGHLTPTVQEVVHVFPWYKSGKQTAILLDCSEGLSIYTDQVRFDNAIELWRKAEFDVTVKEVDDDF